MISGINRFYSYHLQGIQRFKSDNSQQSLLQDSKQPDEKDSLLDKKYWSAKRILKTAINSIIGSVMYYMTGMVPSASLPIGYKAVFVDYIKSVGSTYWQCITWPFKKLQKTEL